MKKHQSWIAGIGVLVVLTIAFLLPTYASENNSANCYCAGIGAPDHVCEDILWTAWESGSSLPYAAGNYYLTQDIIVSGPCWPATDAVIRLDLNGHTVTANNTKLYNMGVYGGVELTITDRSASKTGSMQVFGTHVDSLGMVMEIKKGNVVNLYGGTLDGSGLTSGTCYGVTLTMTDGAAFNQYGGTIIGGTVTGGSGGSLWMASGTTYNMYGGIMRDGKANGNGGNVMVDAGATFHLYGGTVSGGTANYNGGTGYCCGGNFHVLGTLNMHGGVIENGIIAEGGSMGGNISVGYGSFNMTGGTIRGGSCALWGGSNIRVQSGTFHMTGGLVDGTNANDSSVFGDGSPSNIILGGTAKIKGAAKNLVMNNPDNLLRLESSLVTTGEDAAEIWVTAAAGKVLANIDVKKEYENIFHCDNGLSVCVPDGYGVLVAEDGSGRFPLWKSTDRILHQAYTDGFTVTWPAARDAQSYLIQIDGAEEVPVSETSYTVTGASRISGGYQVTVTAVGTGSRSSQKLIGMANAAYDPDASVLDVQTVLVGSGGGNFNSKYQLYRIPGLTVTAKDTLIAYYEARVSAGDNDPMDILAFRSTDGGETWSEPITLAAGADAGITMNNAVIIVDRDGITLHLVYCANYGICDTCGDSARASCENHGGGCVYYRKSVDDGITWSQPVNITDSTAPETRYLFAAGAGNGLCTKDGMLIVPVWLVKKENGDRDNLLGQWPSDISTLYSTDGGQTWQMGQVLRRNEQIASGLEPCVVELSDGRIMYNIRCSGGWRGVAVSDNGYSNWTTIEYDQELMDPFCHAGIAAYDDGTEPYTILFSNCQRAFVEDYFNQRSNLVLKGSADNGTTWSMKKVIEPGDAGYSSLAVDSKGTIYVLYEVRSGQIVKLAKLNYTYLKSDANCYCAGNGDGSHVCEDLTWTPWTKTDSLPESTGNYYLTEDVTVTYMHYLSGNNQKINLDLNGHTITSNCKMLYMNHFSGIELTITDRSADKSGRILLSGDFKEGEHGMFAHLGKNNVLNLYAGTVDGSGLTSNSKYGVVLTMVENGVFHQYGGNILGGTVTDGSGAAVWMGSGTVYHMYGGSIGAGKASADGGNVLISAGAAFYMYGGTVTGGTASYNAGATNYCCGGNFHVTGTLNMSGGVIENGVVAPGGSMGGNVSVSYGTFNMTGGIIRGGSCALWGGSNVRVQNGTFRMTGGLLDGTDANDSSVFADGNPSHIIVGGTAKIKGAERNIVFNLESSYITAEDSLVTSGEDTAEIWVSANRGRAVVNSGATEEMLKVFHLDNGTDTCQFSCSEGRLIPSNLTATVDGEMRHFYSVADALDANAQYIKLHQSLDRQRVHKATVLDLNGYNLTNITVAEGVNLQLMDSTTDDFAGEYGCLSGTVRGTVEAFADHGGKSYLTVMQDGEYSAHCYDVQLTHISLRPSEDALGYKAQLWGDEMACSHVTGFGFNLWVGQGREKTFTNEGTFTSGQSLTLRLKNILAAGGGEMDVGGNAFVTVNVDGHTNTKTCGDQTTSMRSVLETVSAGFDSYTDTQRRAVKTLVTQYADVMTHWQLESIRQWEGSFLVGYGKADITPYEPTPLADYGDPEKRYSQGYLDQLYALTTAMTDPQGNTLLLIVTDLSWGDVAMNNMVRQAVCEKYDIADNHVIVGGTHNHSAPTWKGTSQRAKEYLESWLEAVVASVDAAMEDRKPARMYIGTAETENLTFVRRYWQEDGLLYGDNHKLSNSPIVSHESEADEQMQLVRFVREGGKDMLITNWQSHANSLGWEQPYVASSEWIGRMRAKVEEELDCHCIYFQGAAGNLNPSSKIPEENLVDTWDQHGEAVADAVIRAYQNEDTFIKVNTGSIAVEHVTFTGIIDKSDINKLETAQQMLSLYESGEADLAACEAMGRQAGIETIRHAYGIVGRANEGSTKSMELYAMSIGDLSVVSLPVELFDVTGMQIKNATPFEMTLLMGYACGQELYIPDQTSFQNGGYERHTCLYVSGTAEMMVQTYLQMLQRLHTNSI